MSIKRVFFLLAIAFGVVILLLGLLVPSLHRTHKFSTSQSEHFRRQIDESDGKLPSPPPAGRMGSYRYGAAPPASRLPDGSEIAAGERISGGMGGYRGSGVAPSAGQPLRRVRGRAYYLGEASSSEAQRLEDRRIPAELVNVTEDEIWVIARPETQAVPADADEDTPGSGAMLAKLPKEDKEIPLPLKHTDVKGQISGYIATVDVTQKFHNPYDEKIEAVYVFPLPQNAAVNEFIMVIGERANPRHYSRAQRSRGNLQGSPETGIRRFASYPGAAEYLHAEGRQHRAGKKHRRQYQVFQHPGIRGRLV